jgi:hypothetical protein
MAKKRKRSGNLTPEDHARSAETRRLAEERIAYHDAKAREEDPSFARYAPWASLDDDARFEQTQEMARERIAYHAAKAREEEEAARRSGA